MDSKYILTSNGELYHWGVKGMRWGVRRYQNKDGSLTQAGRRRRDRLESKLEKVTGGSGGSGGSTRKKSINELTDDELRAATNRLNLERDYYNAKKGLDAANPPKESREKRGKKFISSVMNEVVLPAAKTAGKAWVEQTLKDRLGVNDKSTSFDDLLKAQTLKKNEADKELNDLDREIKTIEKKRQLDELKGTQQNSKTDKRSEKKNRREAEKAEKANKEQPKQQEQSASKAETSQQKQSTSKTETSSTTQQKQSTSKAETSDKKVYSGEVSGSAKKYTRDTSDKYEDAIDVDFYEVSVSNVPTTVVTSGRQYVSGLLETPPSQRFVRSS